MTFDLRDSDDDTASSARQTVAFDLPGGGLDLTSDDVVGDGGQLVALELVIPVFNERECLDELVQRLADLRADVDLRGIDLRAILVDDGSVDGSGEMLRRHADRHDWLTSLHLVRNFGHQAAVTAGLDASSAEYVAIIDADLQDPPELIPDMLDQLRAEDVHVVYGIRRSRLGDSWFKRHTAMGFYRLLRWASGLDIPLDTGDFRIMTREVADALRELPEQHRLMRALIPWLGYSSAGFTYDRHERFAGQTKYPLRKMVKLASHAVFAFSTFPIRLVQLAGLALSVLSALAFFILAVLRLSGWAEPGLGGWIASAMVGQTGVLLLAVGVIGGYVFRIQDEVKRRPHYIRHGRPAGERRPALQESRVLTR
jgi:polyisoprenyl-phosphate glycosyltransferase